jgi:hypothetical protein
MLIVLLTLIVRWAAAAPDSPLESLGTLDRQRIPEASGIVKSRRYPGIFWVHNDSGNPSLLFAIRRDGRIVREFRLEVPNVDWEDIAIDDQGHLYLGDIGNNGGVLPLRAIYRVDEPDPAKPSDRPIRASAVAFYAFPTKQRFDAEGLVFDRGVAIIVSKHLDRSPATLFTISLDKPATLLRPAFPQSNGTLPDFVEPATGASLSEQRDLLAICGADVTRIYDRDQWRRWRLMSEIRYRPQPIEGIAWDGRDLILVAEGGGLYRLSEATWRRQRPEGKAVPRAAVSSKPAGARARGSRDLR